MIDIKHFDKYYENNMSYEPAAANCSKLLQDKEHALIGISPFNSYYSEKRIADLIKWGMNNFKDFHLFVPDTLPIFNFLSLGYSEGKAKSKSKHQWNYLKSKISKAFMANGFGEYPASKVITINDTEPLSNNEIYKDIHEKCLYRYRNDQAFKEKCLKASESIFSNPLDPTKNNINFEIAVQYILGELPIALDTPKILGVKSSLFIYHDNIDFFVNLYKVHDELLSTKQGHLIVKFL